jgi:hypothetical protein
MSPWFWRSALLPPLVACALATVACKETIDRPRRQSTPPAARVIDLREASNTVAFRRHQIAQRLRAEPAAPGKRELKCPDDRLKGLASDASTQVLMLAAHDARIGAKHLLPLDLMRQIETGELSDIDRLFDQPPELGGQIRSEPLAQQALGALSAVSKRRFRGVYHIVEYAPPALIHKLGKMRAEWVPGCLVAWLAIEDLDRSEVVCQTRIIVRNDVKDEPVFRRTKSEVKERLIAELGQGLRGESVSALEKISSVLRLPAG